VQPPAVAAASELAPPENAVLLRLAADVSPIHFDVFIERTGANLAGWPGKNAMGSTFVGRIPLAAGAGTCCVIAYQQPVELDPWTMPQPSPEEVAQWRASAERGELYMTRISSQSDGTLSLIDGRVEFDLSE
jgi:hypothetical protein